MAMPTVGSVATAAMPTPKRPAARSATKIMMQMETTGMTTERMPVESPAMMTVAEPVSPALAISRTGLPAVKYSVDRPMEIQIGRASCRERVWVSGDAGGGVADESVR